MANEKDVETGNIPVTDPKQCADSSDINKTSAFKSLGWLDRYLAVWIFLSMVVGILLGNFVPHISQSFQKGQFVGVSVPIGKLLLHCLYQSSLILQPSAYLS